VIFADSRTASFKATDAGCLYGLLWGDTVKGPFAGFTKFAPGFDAGMHSHSKRRVTRRHERRLPVQGRCRREAGRCGRFLADPGRAQTLERGDAKEGALFYQETFGKFDLIPAK